MTRGRAYSRLLAAFPEDPPWNPAVPEVPPPIDKPAMRTQGTGDMLRARADRITHTASCASRAPAWIRGERFETPCSCGANVREIRLRAAAILVDGGAGH